jgi:integrase
MSLMGCTRYNAHDGGERPCELAIRCEVDAIGSEILRFHVRDAGGVVRVSRRTQPISDRESCDTAVPKLSTHSFRKTVATILDKAGLSATEIADYLGHENPSMTQDVYMNTLKGSTRAAEVMGQRLEGLI